MKIISCLSEIVNFTILATCNKQLKKKNKDRNVELPNVLKSNHESNIINNKAFVQYFKDKSSSLYDIVLNTVNSVKSLLSPIKLQY